MTLATPYITDVEKKMRHAMAFNTVEKEIPCNDNCNSAKPLLAIVPTQKHSLMEGKTSSCGGIDYDRSNWPSSKDILLSKSIYS
jgi:hypothetical protein